MCTKILEIINQSVVANVLFFALVCWNSSIKASDSNRLKKLIRKADPVIGCNLDNYVTVVEEGNELFVILHG